jgi:hypothetical protein
MGGRGWSVSAEDRNREQITNDGLKTILILEGLGEQG